MAHRVKGEKGSGASQTIPSQFQFIHCVNCSTNDTITLTKALLQSKHIVSNYVLRAHESKHLSKVEYKAMKNNVVGERASMRAVHAMYMNFHS